MNGKTDRQTDVKQDACVIPCKSRNQAILEKKVDFNSFATINIGGHLGFSIRPEALQSDYAACEIGVGISHLNRFKKARNDVNCELKDGRKTGRLLHLAKAGATKTVIFSLSRMFYSPLG